MGCMGTVSPCLLNSTEVIITSVAEDGREREVLMLPLSKMRNNNETGYADNWFLRKADYDH
jgi:hypothetical protein